jgi:ribosomal protein S18 acetylase RimI-like enzyme
LVRPFAPEDLPAVLHLLDASLGGGPAGRRPPEFFRWKHLESPFGPSFMLVAADGERLVGLRAFMRWRFNADGRTVEAARPVDTATHPDYQGMGIFTRLTRELLDAVAGEVDLVFNTPNAKSGPGYLKLGWHEVGRMPVAVRVRRPGRLAGELAGRVAASAAGRELRPVDAGQGLPAPVPARAVPVRRVLARDAEVQQLLAREPAGATGLRTPRDVAYLRWRYGAAPLLGYHAVTVERDGQLAGLAVFRVRRRGGLWESTIAEVLAGGDPGIARRLLRRVAAAAPVDHLTLHAPPGSGMAVVAHLSGFLPTPAGIRLVVNPLRKDLRPAPTGRGAWALTLGDLEVF